MSQPTESLLADQIGSSLPYLRRYARALTGSQKSGDAYATTTLEAILVDPSQFAGGVDPKVALFATFHKIWSTSGAQLAGEETDLRAKAQQHLASLTAGTREVLLLHTLEDFTVEEVGQIVDKSPTEVEELLSIAYAEMGKSVTGSIMVIEDEAIIAFDLEGICSELGHKVTGIARTESEAIDLFKTARPDLILSDIQLADGSSGIDAVNRIIADAGDIPVIFITAFPERLLTGEGPEPAFLISKPYSEAHIRSAVSQAMFFASSAVLKTS
ncbi:response regulator [Cognatishimia sp. F0-27]|uniref:response regulator n=1 Tax=Cognatishimia sp. F0-27 TaxID=2816855 RepID=UPI001D0C1D5A|nr:response regulator [Cognatishimia sp. F0-27]MCC1493870.1 response regulator [Cognatishimia sp. F0-27]